MKPGYYYLHVNSQIIWESHPNNLNSPYSVKHWRVETIWDYQNMVVEAKKIDNGV